MIKGYEKKLLNTLESKVQSDVPLKNVREAMGSVAYYPGNPLTKTEITLNITQRYFTPGGDQFQTPNYLFGLTDYYSGYPKGGLINPLDNFFVWQSGLTNEFFFGIVGKDVSIQAANSIGLAPGFDLIYEKGDFIMVLEDVTHTTFVEKRISCQNVAYGTFLNSFVSDLITVDRMRFIVPIANINQFINPITFVYQTLFGKTATDSIDPRLFITSTDFQQQICDIPINLPLDKNMLMTFDNNFDCQSISIILFVSKIEPLTHK